MDREMTDVVALQIERADPADLKMLAFRVFLPVQHEMVLRRARDPSLVDECAHRRLTQATLPPYMVTVTLDCGADFPPTDSRSEGAAIATLSLVSEGSRESEGRSLLTTRSRRNYRGYQPEWNEKFTLSVQDDRSELVIQVRLAVITFSHSSANRVRTCLSTLFKLCNSAES